MYFCSDISRGLGNHLFSHPLLEAQDTLSLCTCWSKLAASLSQFTSISTPLFSTKSDFHWNFRGSWRERPSSHVASQPGPSRGHLLLGLSAVASLGFSVSSRCVIKDTSLVYYEFSWWLLLQVISEDRSISSVSSVLTFVHVYHDPVLTEADWFMQIESMPNKGEAKHHYSAHCKKSRPGPQIQYSGHRCEEPTH